MAQQIERPLDLLNNLRGKKVSLKIRDMDMPIDGILLAFDIHINLVINVNGTNHFLRGDTIVSCSEVND